VGAEADSPALAAAVEEVVVVVAAVEAAVEAAFATTSRTMGNVDSGPVVISAMMSGARHLSFRSDQGRKTRAEGEGEAEGSPRVAAVVVVVGTAVVGVAPAEDEAEVEGVFVGFTTPLKVANSARAAPCVTNKKERTLPPEETCSARPWEIRKIPWNGNGRERKKKKKPCFLVS